MNNYPENDYRNYMSHSFLGTQWKKATKYLFKKNGRYYYPGDVAESTARSAARNKSKINNTGYGDYASSEKLNKNKVGRAISSAGSAVKRAAGAPGRAINTLRSKQTLKATRKKMAANTGSADYASSDSRKVRLQRLARSLRSGLSAAALRGSQKVKTGIASLSAKNRERNAYKKTGLTAKQREYRNYRDTGIKNKTAAAAVYGAKQAGRSAKNWATSTLDDWKKKGRNAKRAAYRKTGVSFLK